MANACPKCTYFPVVRCRCDELRIEAKNRVLQMEVKLWKKRTEEAANTVEKFEDLQAESKRLREALEEIGLEQDPIFPKMQHCRICGRKDVIVMGHASDCKLEKALKDNQ